MEIPDLYANSIFVAARDVGRRAASRQPRPFSSERNGEGASPTQMDTRVDEM